ncbi:MAG: hypothetical protein CM15mV49_090 [uncultured marine virus]|nr:MAG: hypothetical protein CM15mV49_090 [uncultured marine virus]
MVDQVLMQRQAPFIEDRAEQLLATTFGIPLAPGETPPPKLPGETDEEYLLRIRGLAGIPQTVPAQQIAPLTQAQETAVAKAQEGLGAYQPFLDAASTTVGAGLGAIGAGVQTLDPSQISTFMNPFSQQVTQQALAELDRQAAIQGQRTAAEAVAAGAFGGSRFGVREAEEARNLAQVKSQRIFEDLSRNFLQAQQAQQRTAQQLGQLGVQTLQAGQAQVGLGEAGQRLGGVDINRLLSVGGVQQQQQQNILEAARRTELARQQEPFRRVGFASDVLRGVPSSQVQFTQQPAPSLFQQVAGLGIQGLAP